MKNNHKFKHVFLITVDALRADHVGCIGGGNLTPNIDEIAKTDLLFTRAFANGPGTNQSFPALMTSTYFLMHDGFHLSPYYDTIAEVLRARNNMSIEKIGSKMMAAFTYALRRSFGIYRAEQQVT